MAGPEEPDDEELASPTTFFSFKDADSDEAPYSGTSPMSKESGKFSEDSTASNCRKK